MRKNYYLVLDTETATLPQAKSFDENALKKIVIAKPLVYNIGWVIIDRQGEIYEQRDYIVNETFFVPQIFNTAYYKEKRPLYIQRMKEGEVVADTWDNIINELLNTLHYYNIKAVTAYNAAFDYKKAIPFTERYIKAIYSDYYPQWEEKQIQSMKNIANGKPQQKNIDYLNPFFTLRNEDFPIVDIWQEACDNIATLKKYKDFCLKHGKVSQSGLYFSTNAETMSAFLRDNPNFIEEHTALQDCFIEAEILSRILKRKKVEPSIANFPFRNLGSPWRYAIEFNKKEEAETLKGVLKEKCETTTTEQTLKRLERIIITLENFLENNN